MWAGIEHSGWTANPDGTVRSGFEERPDFFSSVAFWYQQGVNEDLPEPPYGYDRLPFGNATQLEVPTLIKDVTAEKGKALVQKEVDWAKDLLFLDAEGAGARINIPVDIPEDGQYELIGLIAQAPDYGDYKALLDDQPMNLDPRQAATSEVPFPGPEVFYNYLPEVYVAKDRALGMAKLTKGRHTLSFICVGKDPHSLGFDFGINDVVIARVQDLPPEAASEVPSAPPAPSKVESGTTYRGQPLSYYTARSQTASGMDKVNAVYEIGQFGPDAVSAIPVLSAALSDPSAEVRAAAATSLAKIGAANASAVPMLTKVLSDGSPRVRALAAMALRASGPQAASAVPQLTAALHDPVDSVRYFAASALGTIGQPAASAIPALVERLSVKDERGFVFTSVSTTLGNMGPEAKAALPALEREAKERESSAAQRAILQIEQKPEPATYY